MAIKRKNEKKRKLKDLYAKAVKIRCCYCDLRGACLFRANKEQYEKTGIATYCTMTLNRPKSFIKNLKSFRQYETRLASSKIK